MIRLHSKQLGFSLIELTIFIIIVGFFSVASIRLLEGFNRYSNTPLIQSALVGDAQNVLQAMRFLHYDAIELGERKKYLESKAVELSIKVVYAGADFSLSNNKVKHITVAANWEKSSTIFLSIYRFDHSL